MDKKFKNINGVYLLKELFFETALNKDNVVYTLKNQEHNGYPSLYEKYMEIGDPEEYKFAVACLDGWDHWKLLRECSWFKPYLLRWREELEIKLRSKALEKIIAVSEGTTKDAFSAQKYVAEKGWDRSNRSTKGRPAKADVQREAQRLAEERRRADEDFSRLTVN